MHLISCLARLAATIGPKSNARRLGRRDLVAVNVIDTCAYLAQPPQPLSLRLSASLMIGVSRVYGQQCQYHYSDVQTVCNRLTNLATTGDLDLASDARYTFMDNPPHVSLCRKSTTAITLKTIECISAVNMMTGPDLTLPDMDISQILRDAERQQQLNEGKIQMTPEAGRKTHGSSSSLRSAPLFHSSSSNRVSSMDGSMLLHGDFASAIGDMDPLQSDPHDANDSLFMHPNGVERDFSSEPHQLNVPETVGARERPARPRFVHLFDDDLMLTKDQLFLSDADRIHPSIRKTPSNPSEAVYDDAIALLNGPSGDVIEWLIAQSTPFRPLFAHSRPAPVGCNKPISTADPAFFASVPDDDGFFHDPPVETFRAAGSGGADGANDGDAPFQLMPWSSLLPSDQIDETGRASLSSAASLPFSPLRLRSSSPTNSASSRSSSSGASAAASLPFSMRTGPMASVRSRDTLDFLVFLQESLALAREQQPTCNHIVLNELLLRSDNVSHITRPIAARAFSHILGTITVQTSIVYYEWDWSPSVELCNGGLVIVRQTRPFAAIHIGTAGG